MLRVILSLLSIISISTAAYYQSLFLQGDYRGNYGFKNVAKWDENLSLSGIDANNKFKYVKSIETNTLEQFPTIPVNKSATLVSYLTSSASSLRTIRGILPGSDEGSAVTTIAPTTDVTSVAVTTTASPSETVNKWCAPSGWSSVKIFIPKNITSIELGASVVPSIADLRFHITFVPLSAKSATIDHTKYIKASSYNIFNTLDEFYNNHKQRMTDTFINHKTIEVTGVGNFELVKRINDEVLQDYIKEAGYLYVDIINDRDISSNVETRAYKSSSNIYFLYDYTVNLDEYKTELSTLSTDVSGEPIEGITNPTVVEAECHNSASLEYKAKSSDSQVSWQLISPPVASNIPVSSLNLEKIYSYDGTAYIEPTEIVPGVGYWALPKTAQALRFTGSALMEKSDMLAKIKRDKFTAGSWNLMGTSYDVTQTELKSTLGVNTIWPFDSSVFNYSTDETIKAGSGFWAQ